MVYLDSHCCVALRDSLTGPRGVELVVADDQDTAAGHHGRRPEGHGSGGEFVKSLVFGGLDGIITTFAIIAASQGGGLSQRTIIMMGFANLLADAISMGVGDFLSETAENNYIREEQKREKWEMDNFMEGEINEMIEIYQERGMGANDAKEYLGILARYPKIFLENMMVDELGLMPIKDDDDPYEAAKKGLVTFIAFIFFGSVPVLVYLIYYAMAGGSPDEEGSSVFGVAILATACTLFALGVVKAKLTKQPMLKSGVWMLVNGGLAAAAAFGVGAGLDSALKRAGADGGDGGGC